MLSEAEFDRFFHHAIRQGEQRFRLGERSDETRELYADLVSRTLRACQVETDSYRFYYPDACPENGGFVLRGLEDQTRVGIEAPASIERLASDWQRYEKLYFELRSRSPLLELHDLLWEVSEGIARQGWDIVVENGLRDWVDHGGSLTDLPFDPMDDVLTPALVTRMTAIRRITKGWVYGDGIFLTDEQEKAAPRGDRGAWERFVEDAVRNRPSFEGL